MALSPPRRANEEEKRLRVTSIPGCGNGHFNFDIDADSSDVSKKKQRPDSDCSITVNIKATQNAHRLFWSYNTALWKRQKELSE